MATETRVSPVSSTVILSFWTTARIEARLEFGSILFLLVQESFPSEVSWLQGAFRERGCPSGSRCGLQAGPMLLSCNTQLILVLRHELPTQTVCSTFSVHVALSFSESWGSVEDAQARKVVPGVALDSGPPSPCPGCWTLSHYSP